MYPFKFEADTHDGPIRVPDNLHALEEDQVRVVNQFDAIDNEHSLIDDLLQNPLRLPDFSPLKRDEIYAF